MNQWSWILLLAAYAAGISYMSHQPIQPGQLPFPHFDKLFHATQFGLFFLLAWKATGRRSLAGWILTIIFAIGDEWHQSFIPTRHPCLFDLIANLVGAGFMAIVIHRRTQLWQFFSARILGR